MAIYIPGTAGRIGGSSSTVDNVIPGSKCTVWLPEKFRPINIGALRGGCCAAAACVKTGEIQSKFSQQQSKFSPNRLNSVNCLQQSQIRGLIDQRTIDFVMNNDEFHSENDDVFHTNRKVNKYWDAFRLTCFVIPPVTKVISFHHQFSSSVFIVSFHHQFSSSVF